MLSAILGLFVTFFQAPVTPASPLESLGKFDTRQLPEVSGIVKSQRFADIYWVHNDSGNPPTLFAIRKDGSIVRSYPVEAANIDWEDIAIDDQGHLYLGDIGNNGGRLPLRMVYMLDEPDPSQPSDKPLKPIKSSSYRFDESGRFDAEGLCVDRRRGMVFVVTKRFDRGEATLYEIPFEPPGTILRPVVPRKLARLPEFIEPATGADLSPDGDWLAVCSLTATRIYRREPAKPSPNDESAAESWLLHAKVDYPVWHAEAICWDGRDLILASEGERIARLPEATWSKYRRNP